VEPSEQLATLACMHRSTQRNMEENEPEESESLKVRHTSSGACTHCSAQALEQGCMAAQHGTPQRSSARLVVAAEPPLI
jgi:hypothetical protein